MTKKSTISKKIASYSALAAGVLLGCKEADAQILYTDVIPDDTASVPQTYFLDLNNDGVNDYQFNLIYDTGNPGNQIRVIGNGNNAISRDQIIHIGTYAGYAYADTILNGATIGSAASFYNQEILGTFYMNGNAFGNWVGAPDLFLGLKLEVNANTYYGWARITVPDSCNLMVLHDYAVDTVANEAITAGDKCGNYSALVNTVIYPSDSTGFCEGSNVELYTDSIAGFTYQWYTDSNLIAGANSYNYITDSVGNYSVIVANSYGCIDTSGSIIVSEFPLPSMPVITQSGDTLMSTSADIYQWYLDNTPISGATNQTYVPAQEGSYTVVITDANGCNSESDPYIISSVESEDARHVTIFVADNIALIQLRDKMFFGGQLKIGNTIGETIYSLVMNTETLRIDLSQIPSSIYFITIQKDNKAVTKKIVIQ